MKIRYRLALQFSLIVASILLIFSISIYLFSSGRRTAEFNKRLKNRAITVANLLTEFKDADSVLIEKINRNTVNFLYNENILVYDFKNSNLLYKFCKDTNTQIVFKYDLNAIKEKKEISYCTDSINVIGLTYPKSNPNFIIIASAVNERGQYELSNLRKILIIGYIVSIIITVFASLFFASEAVKPISNIIKQVNNITASKLYRRVFEGKGNDEIATLSKTFNEMLDRLQESFEMQQNFVSNVSHELRTPLTSINGQIEVALLNKRSQDEYEKIIKSIHGDIINMVTLANGFLELAEAGMENAVQKFHKFRIDELLYQVKDEMIKHITEYHIDINFSDTIDDETKLTINGNSYLIKVLFVNIIDNACKFSKDKSVVIDIKPDGDFMNLIFTDRGIGIPKNEINKIMKPFYRGKNVSGIKGHGVGLSIVEKIVNIHEGSLAITSDEFSGAKVTVGLPYDQYI